MFPATTYSTKMWFWYDLMTALEKVAKEISKPPKMQLGNQDKESCNGLESSCFAPQHLCTTFRPEVDATIWGSDKKVFDKTFWPQKESGVAAHWMAYHHGEAMCLPAALQRSQNLCMMPMSIKNSTPSQQIPSSPRHDHWKCWKSRMRSLHPLPPDDHLKCRHHWSHHWAHQRIFFMMIQCFPRGHQCGISKSDTFCFPFLGLFTLRFSSFFGPLKSIEMASLPWPLATGPFTGLPTDALGFPLASLESTFFSFALSPTLDERLDLLCTCSEIGCFQKVSEDHGFHMNKEWVLYL